MMLVVNITKVVTTVHIISHDLDYREMKILESLMKGLITFASHYYPPFARGAGAELIL